MSEFVEQRSAIKFCSRNEISVAETFGMLQKAFGDLTMSQNNVYEVCPESIGLPLYLRAGVILHHRAGGILQSNRHLIE